MANRQPLSFEGIHGFLATLFGDELHAKRVMSLAGATLGVIQSASLAPPVSMSLLDRSG